MNHFRLIPIFFFCYVWSTQACDMNGKTGILPENDLYIPVTARTLSLSEEQFNNVLDKIEAIYAPIFKEKGGKLKLERNWSDGTVNAYAQRNGKNWVVSMFGGLARHEVVTEDGFAMVACHEVGHHIGGAPKRRGFFGFGSWASNEGQADYFATLKCMREYMAMDDNQSIVAEMDVDAFVVEKCAEGFVTESEQALCQRSAMGGQSLARLFEALRKEDDKDDDEDEDEDDNEDTPFETELSFETPDPKIVSKTDDKHPAPQCRMDTYFQGALCGVEKGIDVSNSDYRVGTCNRQAEDELGLRPLCWFKPRN